jgi:hypothetical protein
MPGQTSVAHTQSLARMVSKKLTFNAGYAQCTHCKWYSLRHTEIKNHVKTDDKCKKAGGSVVVRPLKEVFVVTKERQAFLDAQDEALVKELVATAIAKALAAEAKDAKDAAKARAKAEAKAVKAAAKAEAKALKDAAKAAETQATKAAKAAAKAEAKAAAKMERWRPYIETFQGRAAVSAFDHAARWEYIMTTRPDLMQSLIVSEDIPDILGRITSACWGTEAPPTFQSVINHGQGYIAYRPPGEVTVATKRFRTDLLASFLEKAPVNDKDPIAAMLNTRLGTLLGLVRDRGTSAPPLNVSATRWREVYRATMRRVEQSMGALLAVD